MGHAVSASSVPLWCLKLDFIIDLCVYLAKLKNWDSLLGKGRCLCNTLKKQGRCTIVIIQEYYNQQGIIVIKSFYNDALHNQTATLNMLSTATSSQEAGELVLDSDEVRPGLSQACDSKICLFGISGLAFPVSFLPLGILASLQRAVLEF